MRTHYKNGDEISLVHGGCDGCSPSSVNGVICHEHGCPDAWKDADWTSTEDDGPSCDEINERFVE